MLAHDGHLIDATEPGGHRLIVTYRYRALVGYRAVMSSYSPGQSVRARQTIHRSTGSAWAGDTGRVTKVTDDGLVIRWANGAETAVVKDNEVERA